MRWLRTFTGQFATKARVATEYAISLVPQFWTQVVWQLSTAFPDLARRAFGGNAVAYACLKILSQSVAEPPLEACTEASDGELTPLPKTHPLAMLLDRPNELMTGFEMLELIELHVGIIGGSYWWKQRTNGGQIDALWPLRPDRVVPIWQKNLNAPKGERLISGWAYFPPDGGKPILLPRSEVLAFGTPDPAGETGGIVETLGWVQVLADEVAADNEATKFVGALLANYAQPSMLIKTKTVIKDKAEAERLKRNWMAQLGGQHRGEPALLDADTTVERLSFDLQELEFPDVRAVAETRITAAAGVPAILVGVKAGLDRATYSNYEQAREFFTETTLANKWRRYADQFTNDLAPEYGPGIVVRFDTSVVKALAGQRQRNAQPIKEGFEKGVVTVNEYRERVLGLPPIPNGEIVYMPSMVKVVSIEDLGKEPPKPEPPALPPPPQNALPAPASEDDQQEPDEEEEPTEDEEPAAKSIAVRALADDVQRRADQTRDRHAETLAAQVRDYLSSQRERVLSTWSETAKAWPDPDSLVPDDDALAEIVRDGWTLILSDAANDAGAALGITLSFDLANDWVQTTLAAVGERVRGITQTTRDDLAGIIGRAASEGLSISDVAALIREAFAFSESRAEMIARTETAVAYSLGALRSYEESGLVDEVEVLDGDYDAVCQGLNGQKKSLEWARANLVQHPRCRRAFAPVVREG